MARCHVADHDDVHRLLPPEILEDIGVVRADELQHLAVVEELAARLATVLGSTANVSRCHAVPPTRATASSYQHRRRPHPQVHGLQHGQGGGFPGGSNAQMQMGQASPFPSSSRMLEQDLTLMVPRFAPAPARPPVVGGTVVPRHELAKRSSRGTGVFLPCSDDGSHSHHTTRQTIPPRTAQKCRRAAATTVPPGGGRQQDGHAAAVRQRLHLHAQLAIAHAVAGTEMQMLEQQLHLGCTALLSSCSHMDISDDARMWII